LFIKRKTFVPAGATKMKRAKISWITTPHKTTRQLITLLFEEQSQANAARTKIPKKLTIL
jgi:hypothetical protein